MTEIVFLAVIAMLSMISLCVIAALRIMDGTAWTSLKRNDGSDGGQ